MSYAPSFAIINAQELQRLNHEGASASVMSVYLALCAYAQKDDTCFPSLGTIKEWIQGSITQSTISKALRWLREHKFIEQENRTSKQRFRLTYRKMVKATSSLVQRARKKMKECVQTDNRGVRVQTDNRPKNQKIKPSFRKRVKSCMGYGRFDSDAHKPKVLDAESAWSALIGRSGGKDFTVLSEAENDAIIHGLDPSNQHDAEWRSWVYQYWPKVVREFILS